VVYPVKVEGVKRRGRPPKAAEPAESVKGRILDSACQLFYKEGVRATGIERVLSEAKAAKASLYAHYGSKDDLVTAYLKRLAEEWMARIRGRIAPADGRAGLLRLFDMLEEFVRSEEFRGCPFLNAASELADPSHPGRDVMCRQREWLHAMIRALLAAAGVRDLDRLSRAVVVLHDGALASAVLDDDAGAVAAARFAVEQLLDAAPSSRSRRARSGLPRGR
jgi:AcrR family transcriptional regulator